MCSLGRSVEETALTPAEGTYSDPQILSWWEGSWLLPA